MRCGRTWGRLCSERGFALPLALAIVLVLSIAVVGIIDLTGANSRGASLSEARQQAKAIAESGVNSAAAIVAASLSPTALPNCSTTPPTWSAWQTVAAGEEVRWCGIYNAADTTVTPTTETWTVKGEGRVQNPTGPSAATAVATVQAKLQKATVTVTDTRPWQGVFAGAQGDKPLMSDVNAQIETPVYVKESAGKPVEISGGKILNSSFHVYGRLSVTNSIYTSSVGASARPGPSWSATSPAKAIHRVPQFGVKDGCSLTTSPPFSASTCSMTSANGGPTQRFWLPCAATCTSTNETSPAFTSVVPNIPKPVEDFAAEYTAAAPGTTSRNHRCYASSKSNLEKLNPTIGSTWSSSRAGEGFAGASDRLDNDTSRNSGIGTVNLMPDAAYYCVVKKSDGSVHGSIKWTPGNPGTLEVSGKIYFDGSLLLGDGTGSGTTTHGWGRVVGIGYVYVNDYLNMKGDYSGLCGVPDTAADRAANGLSGSPSARGRCLNGKSDSGAEIWDPGTTTNMIRIQSASANETAQYLLNGFQYQGSLYANGGFKLQDTSTFKGPIVADQVQVLNSGLIAGWTPLNDLGELPSSISTTVALRLVAESWRG